MFVLFEQLLCTLFENVSLFCISGPYANLTVVE